MSRTAHDDGIARLDVSNLEQGIRNGRRLQAQAFRSALKSLFSWKKTDERPRRATVVPDCTAAA